jgi:methyl-accepting chemotaxis protein
MNAVRRDITSLRRQANNGLLTLIWLHIPVLAVLAMLLGHGWLVTELMAIGLACAATLCWRTAPDSLETRMTVAVALVGMVALIVDQLNGNAWQIDSHMYFFAALAVLAAYCDWRVLLMGAGAIAVHHLILNFVLPAAVFPGGADFGRVVLHAVIVILETVVLVWLTHQLVVLFGVSHAALTAVEQARASEAESHVRQAALEATAEAAGRHARHELAQRFGADVGALVQDFAAAVAELHGSASALSGTAQRASDSTARIVEASDETSASVQVVAVATEELSASVLAISGQIARAAGSTHQAVEQTRQTTETIERLAGLTGGIETVVQLINGIARQTSLLALNATIEAARAGDAGKGFAVVATEVKALAAQTAKATDEIRSQIAAIQTETGHAVGAIGGITQTIADLGAITAAVAAAVEQQRVATAEIARSARQGAQGIDTISGNLSALAQVSQDTQRAAEAGQAASGRLSGDCGKMASSVKQFVGDMRAA